MSNSTVTRTPAVLSTKNKVGLALAAVLGLNGALVSPFVLADADKGPPLAVLIIGAVLGVITLILVLYTARTASRTGARAIAGVRIVSALLSAPAFFVSHVAPTSVVMASAVIIVTVVTIVLLLSRPATP